MYKHTRNLHLSTDINTHTYIHTYIDTTHIYLSLSWSMYFASKVACMRSAALRPNILRNNFATARLSLRMSVKFDRNLLGAAALVKFQRCNEMS